jgi:hypothetical protein
MKPLSFPLLARCAAVILVAVAAASCSKKLTHMVITNQLPEVRITAAPIDTNQTCSPDPVRSCYALTVNWVGNDADGRVDHYLYVLDPPSEAGADTIWQVTRENEVRVVLSSRRVLPERPGVSQRLAEEPHTFVIKAVDNRGAEGPLTYRAFFSFTEAPSVQIMTPPPSSLVTRLVPPSVRIRWTGRDPDGVFTTKPVKYKFILLNESSAFPLSRAVSNPDSLRRYYAPAFTGWDSTSADTTEIQFTNLTPDQLYMFVVVGFDEAGAYSPVFTLNSNMLRFKVGFAGVQGPRICFFNEFFTYCYLFGGYCPCPEVEVFLELPADKQITMNWYAEPSTGGADIRSYRWALDIQDVSDETPRTDENIDLSHWSARSLNVTSARLGPFRTNGEVHRLYVEAEDNVGLRSLGIVRIVVVRATFENELLIVNDTRLQPDGIQAGGCMRLPLGEWPMAAELDTFLVAAGWKPWRCYPEGTASRPGLFARYPWDTLGTRIGRNDVTVRLATLGRYRHVIWLTDYDGAAFTANGGAAVNPTTALRYMSQSGKVNTLGAYVKQDGRLWVAGGGIAYATNAPWNDRNNDESFGRMVFRSSGARRELAPGRFMYDIPHWQTAIGCQKDQVTIRKHLGRFRTGPDPSVPWTQYANELPETIERKDVPPLDSLPPTRTNPSNFYIRSLAVEFLFEECFIREGVRVTTPRDTIIQMSTLDTLYYATGSSLPDARTNPYNVVMSYYHGPAAPQGVVFTGFSLWAYRRANLQALVDFVMNRMWGIMPTPAARSHVAAGSERAVATPALQRNSLASRGIGPTGFGKRLRVPGRGASASPGH